MRQRHTSFTVRLEEQSGILTGNPWVTGTSILKSRILARNREQALIGSLRSQKTQPTLPKDGSQ